MGAGQIGGIATLLDLDFENAVGFVGTKAEPTEATYVVFFLSHVMMFCAGSLIEAHLVLTTADCVYGRDTRFDVFAGTHHFMYNFGAPRQVEHMSLHRGFNYSRTRIQYCSAENLAILVLGEQYYFNKPEENTEFVMSRIRYGLQLKKTGVECKFFGWGSRRNGFLIPLLIHLHKVTVHILEQENCYQMWNPKGKFLCLTHIPCTSTKYGALCPDDVGSTLECGGFLRGIMTSRMIDRPCGVGFLDLAHYSKFLTCSVDDSRDILGHNDLVEFQHRNIGDYGSSDETTDEYGSTVSTQGNRISPIISTDSTPAYINLVQSDNDVTSADQMGSTDDEEIVSISSYTTTSDKTFGENDDYGTGKGTKGETSTDGGGIPIPSIVTYTTETNKVENYDYGTGKGTNGETSTDGGGIPIPSIVTYTTDTNKVENYDYGTDKGIKDETPTDGGGIPIPSIVTYTTETNKVENDDYGTSKGNKGETSTDGGGKPIPSIVTYTSETDKFDSDGDGGGGTDGGTKEVTSMYSNENDATGSDKVSNVEESTGGGKTIGTPTNGHGIFSIPADTTPADTNIVQNDNDITNGDQKGSTDNNGIFSNPSHTTTAETILFDNNGEGGGGGTDGGTKEVTSMYGDENDATGSDKISGGTSGGTFTDGQGIHSTTEGITYTTKGIPFTTEGNKIGTGGDDATGGGIKEETSTNGGEIPIPSIVTYPTEADTVTPPPAPPPPAVVMPPTLTLNDGYKIPQLALGIYEGPYEELRGVRQIVNYAVEIGYRHLIVVVDSDPVWEEVAQGLEDVINRGLVVREDLFITTKLEVYSHNRRQVVDVLRKYLQNLRLEYVNLYLIDSPVDPFGNSDYYDLSFDTWRGMWDTKKLGLSKSIGVFSFDIRQLKRIISNTEIVPAVNQIAVDLRFVQEDVLRFCQSIGLVVMSFLVTRDPHAYIDDSGLLDIAKKYKKTTSQVLLRYFIELGTIPIPKFPNKKQIKLNFELFDFSLTPEEVDDVRNFLASQSIKT